MSEENKEILILPGSSEITLSQNDIIALNLSSPINIKRDPQEIIDQINAKGGLSILAHPNFLIKPYNRHKLLRLDNYLGIEIYNPGKIPWPESTRSWDFILSYRYDKRVWGFTSDDMHDLKRDAGKAWIMVKTEKREVPYILEALRKGSFYSTTGPLIEDISFNLNRIYIKLKNLSEIRFIGYRRKIQQLNFGKEAFYTLKPEDKYMRIEIKDLKDKKKAWTQPIFSQGGEITYFPYFDRGIWLKGCIHIHTEFDGGKAGLKEIIEWYREHGYDFIAFTEHNFIVHPKNLSHP